eukprot:gene32107-4331_t
MGIMTIPRTVALDPRNTSRLLFWPVEEVASLRRASAATTNATRTARLQTGAHVPPPPPAPAEPLCFGCSRVLGSGDQLDVEIVANLQAAAINFTVTVMEIKPPPSGHNAAAGVATTVAATRSHPANRSGAVDGWAVTNTNGSDGGVWLPNARVVVNSSSGATYEPGMPSAANYSIYADEPAATLRILVDKSVVEVFAQGGRGVVTRRIYLDSADGGAQRQVRIENNAAEPLLVNAVVHQMDSAARAAPSAEVLRKEIGLRGNA